RREHCQIGVFLGYASAKGQAFVDRELYLPEEWAADPARRREAGVPETVTFATKPQLARRMLERALEADVPAAWVTGDELYGNDTDLRRWFEQIHQPYVLAVSSNHPIWQAGMQERADALVASLTAAGAASRVAQGVKASAGMTGPASRYRMAGSGNWGIGCSSVAA
ncbi:MAG TPA: transposase, partial [Anaerolineae bacterium]|nr:transposase [Anaerolineae bacterium]